MDAVVRRIEAPLQEGPPSPGLIGSSSAHAAHQLMIEVHRLVNRSLTLVLLVSGAITAPGARMLEHRLTQAIGSEDSPLRVLLDLNGMTLIDRTGLDVLLDLQRRVVDSGGRIQLVDPSAAIVAMLHEVANDPGA